MDNSIEIQTFTVDFAYSSPSTFYGREVAWTSFEGDVRVGILSPSNDQSGAAWIVFPDGRHAVAGNRIDVVVTDERKVRATIVVEVAAKDIAEFESYGNDLVSALFARNEEAYGNEGDEVSMTVVRVDVARVDVCPIDHVHAAHRVSVNGGPAFTCIGVEA